MSESRGGESRSSYSSYTTTNTSYGESRSGESRTSSYPSYTVSYDSNPTPKKEKSTTDIGDIRSQVMQELYDEFYADIKSKLRQELEKEKPEMIRELKDGIKERLMTDLKRNLTSRGEDR